MNRFTALITILLLSVNCFSQTEEFSPKEKSIIYTNAIKVLEDYQSVMNQMGEAVITSIESARSSSEAFLELFVNRQVLIFNDLDPAHKLSEFYEAETYSNNLLLWYPDGLEVKLDLMNARVGDIISHGQGIFSIDILLSKSINGNYLNQTLNKNNEELTFRIAFSLENKTLGKFRIVGVRSSSSDYLLDYTQALRELNSETFNDEDIERILTGVRNILKDYINFLSLTGDPQESDEDKEFYKQSFLKLFPNSDTRVYNDITPSPETNLITVNDYINQMLADYPNGIRNISINTDSVKTGNILKSEDGGYYTYADADKFFSGNYKGREAFRQMFPLIFRISFKASGNVFTDFIISSIDISSVNFYEAKTEAAAPVKPNIVIRPVSRKGLGMSLIASFGQTAINDKTIESLTIDKDLHSWNVTPLYGFISAIGVSYYFTDNIAARTGLEYNKYSAKFNLNGKFTDNTLSTDVNNDSYYRMVEASFDSVVTINYVSLPLLVNYTSGIPGKIGFYAEGGFKLSIPQKATYKNTGSYKFSGYYPTHPTVIQYLDLPELGFYTNEDIDSDGKMSIKGINLALYASAGINFPLGYYSSITFGPELILGLSDIMGDKSDYYDIFGKAYKREPTKIRNIGLRISLAYKL